MNEQIMSAELDRTMQLLLDQSRKPGASGTSGEIDIAELQHCIQQLSMQLNHYREQLSAGNRFLQDVVDNITEVVYVISVEGADLRNIRHEFISSCVTDLIGCSPAEVLDNSEVWYHAIHPEDRNEVEASFYSLLSEERATCTYRIYPKYGDGYIWVEDRMRRKPLEVPGRLQIIGTVRDVTVHQKAKAELERTNTLVSRIIETSDQFFYVVSYDETDPLRSSFSFASRQVEMVSGATLEQIKQHPRIWFERIHPDDVDGVLETNRQLFRTGLPATRVYRIRNAKTEAYEWVEDYICPVFDKHSRVTELYGSARAITEKKRAEEELDRQKQFTEMVLNNLPVDVAVFDATHRYLYVSKTAVKNPAMRKWLLGKDDFDYCRQKGISEDLAVRRRAFFNKSLDSQAEIEWVDEHQSGNGEVSYIMRRFSPYYENGELQYVVGYGVNITQLKKAKDQLAEKEIYLRTLLHSIPDLILRVNASGSLLDFKAAPGSSLADRLSNFKNRTLHELWKEKAEFHMRYVAEAIANNAPVFYEYDITDTSGAIRVFEVRVYNNGRQEVVMIVREVTKKKKAEAEREKLITELHHRNNELMQFSNILSHNFRAPLANILGLTGLLNSTMEEEERHKIYDYIKHSAESMDQLIRDLNSILSTKSTLNTRKEVFSMAEVVASVQEHLSAQIEETGAMLQIEIEQAADTISSVKSYVQSAVFNLVSNAIKYRKEGRRPQIHLTARRIDEQIRICVSDNGIGVDLAKHGKEMFGLYKRFNVEKEGKGLGLHMTKTQIEALGGSISITSNPGEGTEFTICLPQ